MNTITAEPLKMEFPTTEEREVEQMNAEINDMHGIKEHTVTIQGVVAETPIQFTQPLQKSEMRTQGHIIPPPPPPLVPVPPNEMSGDNVIPPRPIVSVPRVDIPQVKLPGVIIPQDPIREKIMKDSIPLPPEIKPIYEDNGIDVNPTFPAVMPTMHEDVKEKMLKINQESVGYLRLDTTPPILPPHTQVFNHPLYVNPIFDTIIPVERNAQEIALEIITKRVHSGLIKNETPRNKRLYELAPLIEILIGEVESYAEENEGEMPLDICDAIEALEMEREKKIINVALYYKDLKSKALAIEKERKVLEGREKAYKKKAESLLNYLQMNMAYKEKVEDERIKFSWRSSKKCIIVDENKLPEGTYTTVKKPLISDIIKPLLTAGDVVPGAELKDSISLSIK